MSLQQLRNVFAEDCAPVRGCLGNCFTTLLTSSDHTSPMVRFNATALSILHARSVLGESEMQLLCQARSLHGAAMSSLRRNLKLWTTNPRAKRLLDPDATLISILCLSLYREAGMIPANEAGLDSDQSWCGHISAAANFIRSVQPTSFGKSSLSKGLILHTLFPLDLKMSIFLRKPTTLSRHDMKAFFGLFAKRKGSFSTVIDWFDILMPLPGLLSEIDSLLHTSSRGTPHMRLSALAGDVIHVRRRAQRLVEERVAPRQRDVRSEHLSFGIEEHTFMSTNTLFSRQYEFASLEESTICLLTWIACLIVDCTALRILARYPGLCAPYEATNVEQSAHDTAVKLCRTIHQVSTRDNVLYAQIAAVVVDMAAAFFAERAAVKELAWCSGCRVATDIRLRRMRSGRNRSLCRIADVAEDLVSAVSVRGRFGAMRLV